MKDQGRGRKDSTARRRAMVGRRRMIKRTTILMGVCGLLTFALLAIRLWDITIIQHDAYQAKAAQQRSATIAVSARRGEILDTNGNALAVSATVYKLILSPLDLINSVDKKDFTKDDVLDEKAYQAEIDRKRTELIDGLCKLMPDLDKSDLERRMEKTHSQYEVLENAIEEEQADEVRAFLKDMKTSNYLYLTPDAKRYYPYGNLAAQALGFVNADGGAYGLEAYYNNFLEGSEGWVLTEKTGRGLEMFNSNSDYIDASNGYDLKLTLDTTIQSYAEKTLEEGIKAYDIQNGAFCIVMNPQTGEILAIASAPTFDLNNYSSVSDQRLLAQIEKSVPDIYKQLKEENETKKAAKSVTDSGDSKGTITGDMKTEEEPVKTDSELQAQAKSQAMNTGRFTMWRNKAVGEAYEPGSTFKAVVLAAALEEGVISENDTFYCPGYYTVNGVRISCSDHEGHGQQTLAEAVQNSCNPAFMMIGQKLGAEKFYDYFEAFGLTEKTGVDLPGEGMSQDWGRDYLASAEGYLSLATASFGQRFKITPLQNIRAFAAVINGGYLLQPHIVESVSSDGTVVKTMDTNVVRQVISQETSERCRTILESVVAEGTGNNAYVAGYRIGGKTGTSETEVQGEVIVSFMGFAPADDPQVLALLAYDRPARAGAGSNYSTTGVYISGGNMAAKQMGSLMSNILDYLGVEKKYTAAESASMDVQMPVVTGITVDEAAAALREKNLKYRTVGQGDTVTMQVPARGTEIPGESTVILYLGDAKPAEKGQVPNVVGLGYEAARTKLEQAGFFMRAIGSSTGFSSTTKIENQSVAAGQTVAIGTVIDVRFASVVTDGL